MFGSFVQNFEMGGEPFGFFNAQRLDILTTIHLDDFSGDMPGPI
jgi:hypothetical protein